MDAGREVIVFMLRIMAEFLQRYKLHVDFEAWIMSDRKMDG